MAAINAVSTDASSGVWDLKLKGCRGFIAKARVRVTRRSDQITSGHCPFGRRLKLAVSMTEWFRAVAVEIVDRRKQLQQHCMS